MNLKRVGLGEGGISISFMKKAPISRTESRVTNCNRTRAVANQSASQQDVRFSDPWNHSKEGTQQTKTFGR